ncbi:MAG: DUF86 domain-containing protein, partial [Armatimonadetes bacterium]|nr:DUF86 domain-containing protein [Armatimonadota bacterium]
MLDRINRIAEYTAGMTVEAFVADRWAAAAVARELITVGEAARHVAPQVRRRYPEVPWDDLMTFRNFAVHTYEAEDPVR